MSVCPSLLYNTPWIWRQHVPSKRRCLTTSLHALQSRRPTLTLAPQQVPQNHISITKFPSRTSLGIRPPQNILSLLLVRVLTWQPRTCKVELTVVYLCSRCGQILKIHTSETDSTHGRKISWITSVINCVKSIIIIINNPRIIQYKWLIRVENTHFSTEWWEQHLNLPLSKLHEVLHIWHYTLYIIPDREKRHS